MVSSPTRSIEALPATCNVTPEAPPVNDAPLNAVPAGSAAATTPVVQSSGVWPSGAWLIANAPPVTFNTNGPKARSKLRSVAAAAIHASPAVLVIRTSCNVPETPTPGAAAEAVNLSASPLAPAPNGAAVTLNWSSVKLPWIVSSPTRSIEAEPATCNVTPEAPPVNDAPLNAVPAGSAAATAPVVQSSGVWPSGAWLIANAPPVTFNTNGPKARSKLRSVAAAAIHASPAVLVIRTSCNVPETPTPGAAAEAVNLSASPLAPAPNGAAVTLNWSSVKLPWIVSSPTRSIEAEPATCNVTPEAPPVNDDPLNAVPAGSAAATAPAVQSSGGWPSGAWLIASAPPVTFNTNGPKARSKLRSVAAAAIHASPAVLVIRTSCNVPETPTPGAAAEAVNLSASPLAPAPNGAAVTLNWSSVKLPWIVSSPTRSIEAEPATCNVTPEAPPVNDAPLNAVPAGSAAATAPAVQSRGVWPSGAWLIANAPPVTFNTNGPKARSKLRSVAAAAIHASPAVLVIRTSCNVPETPTPGAAAEAVNLSASPLAPAPNGAAVTLNWSSVKLPWIVSSPTRSIEAEPATCNVTPEAPPVNDDPLNAVPAGSAAATTPAVQSSGVWPSGAWLIANAPPVTFNTNGPKARSKLRSVAAAAIHASPAVLVIRTSCNVPETPTPGAAAEAVNLSASPLAPAPNGAAVTLNWSSVKLPWIVSSPTRSIEAEPATCNVTPEAPPVNDDPLNAVPAGSAAATAPAVQSSGVWPSGAWLIANAPPVTFNTNGPKARSKLRSVAAAAIHASPAVLVIRTSCNVPETPTPGAAAEAVNLSASPLAPAPNGAAVTLNWSSVKLPWIVSSPTRSIE